MTPEIKLTNIESSFAMEDLPFDEECRDRIKKILEGTLSIQEAIAESNKKYKMLGSGGIDHTESLSINHF